MVPADLGIQEPTLVTMITQYNALQLQHNTLVQTTGPSNASLLAIEASIDKLRQQIQEALKNVRHSYQIAANKMEEQINSYRTNIRSVPSKAKNLLDIERQQKIKQDLYLFLLQKREEAAISAAATVSGSYPLEDASASNNPVKPNKSTTYLIALFAGILLPVLVIAVLEMLNDKIREREEIAGHTKAPIIGEVGHAGEETLVVRAASRTVVAEQFRIMRTNVQYLVSRFPRPVILVTSSVSGEGKSFIATNYGAAMALTGKRTVVLEFDIRKPRLLKGLGMQASKGLSNYIIGNVTNLEEIIQPVPDFPNLFVIGCGPVPPNPSELLLDEKVAGLFAKLKTDFDYIIIDTAPVGLVSDAFTLSNYADACLYIIRHSYTLKRQLNMVEDLYVKKRLPNMGLVINDIQTQGRYKGYYGYGGGSYYGYGYGYGYGGDYFQESSTTKRRSWFKIHK
jgi:capsular exopolysaccharide synthesis family protein